MRDITTGRSDSLERRAEIGARRRAKTRATLVRAAYELLGGDLGNQTKVEDICAQARIARGTFYNYYDNFDAARLDLHRELTRELNASILAASAKLDSPAHQLAAGFRYYLQAAQANHKWTRAFINSTDVAKLPYSAVARHVNKLILQGIRIGEFPGDAKLIGRDTVIGAGMTAIVAIHNRKSDEAYQQRLAKAVLRALNASSSLAEEASSCELAPLTPIEASGSIISLPCQMQRRVRVNFTQSN